MTIYLIIVILFAVVFWLIPGWARWSLGAIAGAFMLPHGENMTVVYFLIALCGVASLFVGYVIFLHYPARKKWCRPLLVCGALLLLPTFAQHTPKRLNSWDGNDVAESAPMTLTLPTDTPTETVELIQNAAPALEKNLPGLLKYQSSLTFLEIRAGYNYSAAQEAGFEKGTTVTWLDFKVADDDRTIPKDYFARGHRIAVGIEDTGKALILQKRQAKSVFLDQPFLPARGDLVIPILGESQ
jgi:hypothetical protein